jgi:hypothetical protein
MLVDRVQIPVRPAFKIYADESDDIDPSTNVDKLYIPSVGSYPAIVDSNPARVDPIRDDSELTPLPDAV